MKNRLSLPVRTKLSLFVSVLSNLVLFFALLSTPNNESQVEASTPTLVTRGLQSYLNSDSIDSYDSLTNEWLDISGNENNASVKGGVTFISNSGIFETDGSNDGYIDTNINPSATSGFTVEISYQHIFEINNFWAPLWASEEWYANTGYILYFSNATSLVFAKGGQDPGGLNFTLPNSTFISNLNTYSVSVIESGVNEVYAKLYINGVYEAGANIGAPPNEINNTIKLSSRHSNGDPFTPGQDTQRSRISMFRYYSEVLSDQEISQNFTSGGLIAPLYDRYDSGIIRIDKDKVDDDLTNFPVTIVLNSGNFDFSLVQSSGADIFFTDTNDNLLPFEVDYFNHASGVAVYHVLYSGVITSGVENQDILIRYGDVDNYSYNFSDGYNPTDVWDDNYVLVMHMGDSLEDSTRYNNDGTSYNLSSGISNKGQYTEFFGQFNGLIAVYPSSSLKFGKDDFTISVFQQADLSANNRTFVSQRPCNGGQTNAYYFFYPEGKFSCDTPNLPQFTFRSNGGELYLGTYNAGHIEFDTDGVVVEQHELSYLSSVRRAINGTNSTISLLKNDSSPVLSDSLITKDVSNSGMLVIGQNSRDKNDSSAYDGKIYEVRLSNTSRSNAWIKAEYHALSGDLAKPLYTVSFETNSGTSISTITGEVGSGISPLTTRSGYLFDGWYTDSGLSTLATTPLTIPMGGETLYAKWTPSYNRYDSGIIRIDKDKVDDDLTNFPVTIVLNSGNFDFSLVQSSGADVFFTDTNDNLLPFEVDYFNHSSEIAVYHVLYSGVITSGVENQDILIRYGSVEDYFYDFSRGYQSSGVWDANYVLVMHMGEILKDSSRYGLSTTNNGSSITQGTLGIQRQFDGVNDFIQLGEMNSGVYDYSQGISVTYSSTWAKFDFFSRILDFGNSVDGNPNAGNNNIIVGNYGINSSGFFEVYGSEGISAFSENQLGLDQNQSSIVSYTLNGSSGITFKNGIKTLTKETSVLPNTVTRSSNFIGESNWANDAFFEGSIDELRVSRIARTDAWITAEYYGISGELANPIYTVTFDNNGGTGDVSVANDAGTTITFTPTRSGFSFEGWYEDNTTFNSGITTIPTRDIKLYAKWIPSYDRFTSGIIRIDKDKVDDDLTNFPVTIVLNSGNFDFSLVQSSGADVFFTDTNDNLLPFEVDYFSHDSGIAVYLDLNS